MKKIITHVLPRKPEEYPVNLSYFVKSNGSPTYTLMNESGKESGNFNESFVIEGVATRTVHKLTKPIRFDSQRKGVFLTPQKEIYLASLGVGLKDSGKTLIGKL